MSLLHFIRFGDQIHFDVTIYFEISSWNHLMFENDILTFLFLPVVDRHCHRRPDCSPFPGVDRRQVGLRRSREGDELRYDQGQDVGD